MLSWRWRVMRLWKTVTECVVKLQPATVLCQEHLKPACALLVQCGRVSRFIEVQVKQCRTYKIFGRHSLTRPKPRASWESFYLYIHYQPPSVWSHWNKAKTQFISVRARVGFGLHEFCSFWFTREGGCCVREGQPSWPLLI